MSPVAIWGGVGAIALALVGKVAMDGGTSTKPIKVVPREESFQLWLGPRAPPPKPKAKPKGKGKAKPKGKGKAQAPAKPAAPPENAKTAAGKPKAPPKQLHEWRAKNPAVSRMFDTLSTDAFKFMHEQGLISFTDEELNRRMAESRKKYPLKFPKDDKIGQICFVAAFFKENIAGYNIAIDKNIHEFVKSCRAVYKELEPEVKQIIETNWRERRIHKTLYEELRPQPLQDAKTCAGGVGFKTYEELRAELGEDAEWYRTLGVAPLKERHLKLSEVREAFRRGEVARFNGLEVVPKRFLNITLAAIRDLHPKTAHEVPIFSGASHGMWERCHTPVLQHTTVFPEWKTNSDEILESEELETAMRAFIPWILDKKCNASHKLSEVDDFKMRKIDYDIYWWQPEANKRKFRHFLRTKDVLGPSAINLKRLPNIMPNIDFAEKLGMKEEVLHTHRYLWMGLTPGLFHPDGYDNFYIHLSTPVDMHVFPPNCTTLMEQGLNGVPDGTLNFTVSGMPRGELRAPFYHMRLNPGDGVLIPSGAFHKAVVKDDKRVSVNGFFEPKWRRLRDPANEGNHHVRSGDDVLATRQLWIRAAKHLWDTQKISMMHHTYRMEVI